MLNMETILEYLQRWILCKKSLGELLRLERIIENIKNLNNVSPDEIIHLFVE